MIHTIPNNEPFYTSAIERAVSFLSQPRVLLISALAVMAFPIFNLCLEASLEQRSVSNHPELCGMQEEPVPLYVVASVGIYTIYLGITTYMYNTIQEQESPEESHPFSLTAHVSNIALDYRDLFVVPENPPVAALHPDNSPETDHPLPFEIQGVD